MIVHDYFVNNIDKTKLAILFLKTVTITHIKTPLIMHEQ